MTAEPLGPGHGRDASEIPASEARNHMGELLDAVRDGEIVYLTRRGKRIAAMVPADVAEHYEQLEDAYWSRRAAEADTGDTVPWSVALAELEGTRE